MAKCKHCGKEGSHHCSVAHRQIDESSDSGDFILSTAIGAVTDSALLGGLLGGSIVGGIVGDILSDGDLNFF